MNKGTHKDPSIMFTQLTPNLSIYHGNVNVGVLRDGDRALLIDCGDGAVAEGLDGSVEEMLFTHYHRDQACGAARLAAWGARVCAAKGEADWFARPSAFWNDPKTRYHIYDFHPDHNMLAEDLPVHRTVADGDTIVWGESTITALSTPGHTDGSVSYLVDTGGKRIAFVGDLIYAPGQIWELYSLQKGNEIVRDYHGFMGAKDQVIESLRKVVAAGANILAPSHGQIINNPAAAVDTLQQRLAACYNNYTSISALRFYFPQMFADRLNAPNVMPIRQGAPPPHFLQHFQTTWILVSESGAAFVIDCGYPSIVDELRRRQTAGEIGAVEGLWITHYHDDHVDAVREFKEAFGGQVIADSLLADVIADPLSWRLTCISDKPAQVDRRTTHSERWQWHEFTMTAFAFPGQTLYHGALLAEGQGQRLLFVGDSFTPAGIDDYCAMNRNFLGAGQGFDRCLEIVSQLNPVTMFNNHVDVGFTFNDREIAFMRETLAKREHLFEQLLPWDSVNYGLDESWVRCSRYELHVSPGETACVDVVVTNHSSVAQSAVAGITLPTAWGGGSQRLESHPIPPRSEGRISFRINVPKKAAPVRYILPVDIELAGRIIRQINECVVQVV